MNTTSTHPPKERVNIAYKSATSGRHEEIELPLKMLVLGDMTGDGDIRPIEERTVNRIDPERFDAVMASYQLKANVELEMGDADEPQSVLAQLHFKSLKDFEPERLCKQVAPLAKLLELRQALVALKGPLGNLPAFRKKIESLLRDPDLRQRLLAELGVDQQATEETTSH